MATKESQVEEKKKESLEKILLYTKDISSYLDNINDVLNEILDRVKEYESYKDELDSYDMYEGNGETW